MEPIDFTLQTATKPAFENIIWSRPERSSAAGNLLIIGGHASAFSTTQQAFSAAERTGAGDVRVCLPNSLKKIIGELDEVYYLQSTPSGSFAEAGYDELLSYITWADGVLLPGELSENSETELMVTKLISKTTQPVVISGDGLTLLWRNLDSISTERTTVVCSYKQLQQLVVAQSLPVMIKRDDSYPTVRDNLLQLHTETKLQFVVAYDNRCFVAADNRISQNDIASTPELSTFAATLLMQFPARQFEALTTAVYLSVADNQRAD